MSLDANGESEPTGRVPANTVATSAVLPQYHHRGSCMSLDANGESVPARSSLVCMSCCPHRQCSVESPHQRCCRNWPTESRSLNANGESMPFAVRTGPHFMQYNHHGSCMRRPPCRRNTITESRCRQCSVERRVAPCRRNTITEVAARASMPTERRRWSAFHAARTGNVRLRVPAKRCCLNTITDEAA